jgi:hypothetical protein
MTLTLSEHPIAFLAARLACSPNLRPPSSFASERIFPIGNPIQVLADGVTLCASPSIWIEGEAIRQLKQAAALPGMLRAGLPLSRLNAAFAR